MITTLTGPNAYMFQKEYKRIVNEFISSHTDMGLDRLDGEEVDFDRIRESLESLPFLATKKLVVIRSGSSNKQFVEHIEKLLTNLPETTDVLLLEPKLDKRSSYYKLVKKFSDYKEFNELDGNGLARWLVSEAKKAGGALSMADATLLVSRVGAKQQMLANELKKLLLYNPSISKQTIELLIEKTPQSTTFDLLDAALNGQAKQAIVIYEEQRKQKVEPVQIIALLAWQLHVLAIIKTAGNRDPQTIASEAKLNPFVVRKSLSLARKLSLTELKERVRAVRDLDIRLKSESINPDEAMLNLLMQMNKQ